MQYIEIIKDNQEILAIIIRKDFSADGINFFTPDNFPQQLAYISHKKGKKIKSHVHNTVKREVHSTQEVLIIKRGRLKVDLFRKDQSYCSTHILNEGDVIFLANGGHGFEAIEDMAMIEVKQGPYIAEMDKIHFEGKI